MTWNGCIKLDSITIPKSVTSIEFSAFLDREKLTSITIPRTVTSIDEYAFDERNNDLIIKGSEGSYAQTFAKQRNINFEIIP